MSDLRAVAAREAHREAERLGGLATRARAKRDDLIRQLRAEDPTRWSYTRLAVTVGCSRELIAHIVKQRDTRPPIVPR